MATRVHPRPIVTLIEWATGLPPLRARLVTVAMFLLVGSLDILSGRGVSFNGLYLLTLCFTAWTQSEKTGFPAAVLCGGLTLAVNGFGDGHSVMETTLPAWTIGWNILMRMSVNVMVVALVSSFRLCFDQERMLARRDPLTGLLNKRAFFEDARARLAHAERLHQAVVLAYADLDGFKGVNDRFGHAAGDGVLRGFAEAAVRALRPYDLAGRIGGDEFVFLLTVPRGGAGPTIAERIHAALSESLAEAPCPVTCSAGAIVIEQPVDQDGEALVKLADALMYEVKNAGKNALRVAVLDATSGPRNCDMPAASPGRTVAKACDVPNELSRRAA